MAKAMKPLCLIHFRSCSFHPSLLITTFYFNSMTPLDRRRPIRLSNVGLGLDSTIWGQPSGVWWTEVDLAKDDKIFCLQVLDDCRQTSLVEILHERDYFDRLKFSQTFLSIKLITCNTIKPGPIENACTKIDQWLQKASSCKRIT